MGDARARRPVAYRIQRLMRRRRQAAGAPGSSLFWLIQVSADSTSASSLAVNPSILTPVASAFFLASSALATECTHTSPRRTLAVNFCCFSSFITRLLKIGSTSCGTIHDNRGYEEQGVCCARSYARLLRARLRPSAARASFPDAGTPLQQRGGQGEHQHRG